MSGSLVAVCGMARFCRSAKTCGRGPSEASGGAFSDASDDLRGIIPRVCEGDSYFADRGAMRTRNDLHLVRNKFRATVRSVRGRDALLPGAHVEGMTAACGPRSRTRRYQGAASCVLGVFRGFVAGTPKTAFCVTRCCTRLCDLRPLLRTTNNKGRAATRGARDFFRVLALTATLPAQRGNIKDGTMGKRVSKVGNCGFSPGNDVVGKLS